MKRLPRLLHWLLPAAALWAAGCAGSAPRFNGREASSPAALGVSADVLEGTASYYADDFHGRKTSNGETYDMNALTAAHRTLPFNTRVRVTNKQNGKSVIVRINDRGPFAPDRIIDLSLGAALHLGMVAGGTAPVTLEIVEWGAR